MPKSPRDVLSDIVSSMHQPYDTDREFWDGTANPDYRSREAGEAAKVMELRIDGQTFLVYCQEKVS